LEDWNPNLYLRFEKERTQPVKDLISRIEKAEPARIIDIGCGPGNSTRELKNKWPQAYIVGLDSSPNMLKKARKVSTEIEWIEADGGADLSVLGKFDIVFSNAAIQWIPDHEGLLRKLFFMLNKGGVLAVQIPHVGNMGINKALQAVVTSNKWNRYFKLNTVELVFESPQVYYDILSRLTSVIYLWETHYYHVMENHQSIIDWYESTGMKPYLDRLPDAKLRFEFSGDILKLVEHEYEVQQDGHVLFPFRRIFFTAYNE